jgi:hypothetical protein
MASQETGHANVGQAWSSPRWLGSVNFCRKVTDLCCCPSLVAAVRPLRAASTWLDAARERPSNHQVPARKLERDRAGKGQQGGFLLRSSEAQCDAAAEHENSRCACTPHMPGPPALSVSGVTASQECSGVDVRPRSSCSAAARRARLKAGSAQELERLLSLPACRRTCRQAGNGCVSGACSAARMCLLVRAAHSTFAVHDHVPYRCRLVCV